MKELRGIYLIRMRVHYLNLNENTILNFVR